MIPIHAQRTPPRTLRVGNLDCRPPQCLRTAGVWRWCLLATGPGLSCTTHAISLAQFLVHYRGSQ